MNVFDPHAGRGQHVRGDSSCPWRPFADALALASRLKPAVTFVEGTLELTIHGIEIDVPRERRKGSKHGLTDFVRRLSHGHTGSSRSSGSAGSGAGSESERGRRHSHGSSSGSGGYWSSDAGASCRVAMSFPGFERACPLRPIDASGRSFGWSEEARLRVTAADLPAVRVAAFHIAPDGLETLVGSSFLRFDTMVLEGRTADGPFPILAGDWDWDEPAGPAQVAGRVHCRLRFHHERGGGRPLHTHEAALAEGADPAKRYGYSPDEPVPGASWGPPSGPPPVFGGRAPLPTVFPHRDGSLAARPA